MLGPGESDPHVTLKEEEKPRIVPPLREGQFRRVKPAVGTTMSVVCVAASAVAVVVRVMVILFALLLLLFELSFEASEFELDEESELLKSDCGLFLRDRVSRMVLEPGSNIALTL